MSADKQISLAQKREFAQLTRQKTHHYLQLHNFSELDKKILKKYRRNHQNKTCSQNYRSGFKEKIDMLEKKNAELHSQLNWFMKEYYALKGVETQQKHWKKKILQNCFE